MARPRYPSDERRLSRPSGINLAYSILSPNPDKPGHSEVFENPEKRGIWVGLLLKAGHAFAGRSADRVTLSAADLTWVTGRTHRAPALGALRVVCDLMGYSVEDRGRSVVVQVENLSQNQGWTTQGRGVAPRSSVEFPPPPSTSTSTSTSTKKESQSPRKRSDRTLKRRNESRTAKEKRKPSYYAMVAFCEEYKAKRGVNPAPEPRHMPALGEVYEQLGEDMFRASLRIFFDLKEPWIVDSSYSPGAFLSKTTQCSVRAQNYAAHERRRADREAAGMVVAGTEIARPEPSERAAVPAEIISAFRARQV